jgi:hypothetical protein
MSGHRERSELTHLGEAVEEWVDFPPSPDPDPWETLLKEAHRLPPDDVSCGDHWDAKHVGGVMATSAAIALRGLLVTTIAVATVAYLLLTNSHI